MKKLFLLLCILMPFISRSQTRDTSFTQVDEKFKKVSAEMIKFHKQFQTGILLELLGGVTLAIGSAHSISDNGGTGVEPLVLVGGVLTLVGFFINVSSTTHIKNAAIYLQGNSLVIPFQKKTKK